MTPAERLVVIEDAYFSGEKSVMIDGQRIEYQDMDQMWKAVVRARNEASGATRPPLVQAVPTMYNRGRR